MTQPRPNLLYIHSDQHNPFVTSCYGDPLVQTPHLDGLAARGVVFDAAYCPSPICVPSRMAALTGRHPYQNRVWTNEHILDSGIPTLAHALGAAGYRPALVGRMHALGPDQLHGYAERLVGDHSPNHIGGSAVDRGVLNGAAGPQRISLERAGAGQSAYQVHDECVTAAAVDWLNQIGVERRAGLNDAPFCLTVGFMLPHPPYVARPEDYARYRQRMTLPQHPEPFSDALHPHLRWWRQYGGIETVSEAETLRARAAYWGLVTRVDAMVGEILAALERNHLSENTLIVYTSDHGDMVGEHGLWWKHVFYEASVRVPLIVSWPGVVLSGERRRQVVSALDVTAMLLDALGAPPLPSSPGRSLLPLLRDAAANWDDVAFAEYCSDEYAPPGGCYQRMIRRGDWKLVYYHGQRPQLFNLADDPAELHDLAEQPAYQAIQQELTEAVLADWHPDAIAREMAQKQSTTRLLKAWAQQTHPPEQYRWDLRPEMNRLLPDSS